MKKISRTISLTIFKNPKYKDEFEEIIKEDILKIFKNSPLSFKFVETNKVGNVMGWSYLERDVWGYCDDDAKQKEKLLFQIYRIFFPNEVVYVCSEAELEGGHLSLIYLNGKREYIDMMSDFSYWIRKMFQKYDDSFGYKEIKEKIQLDTKKEIEKIKLERKEKANKKKLKIQELEQNEKEFLVKCLKLHKKNVTSIDINPEGNRIISGSRDKTIIISDFNGIVIRSLSDEPQEIKKVIFHQEKNRETIICIAYNDFNPKIYIIKWDINTGNLIKKFAIEGDTEWKSASIDVCLEKNLIVSANSKGEIPIKLYDLKNGRLIKTFEKQKPFTIPASKLFSGKVMTGYRTFNTISISPDGKYLISGHSGQGGNIKLWDVKSGIVIKQFLETGWVNILRFSKDGKIVISGKLDGIKLWNLSTQQLIGELEAKLFDRSPIVFSPNNKFIACGEIAGKIKIWEFKTKKLITEFQAHTDAVTSLRFSSDGKIMISSGSWTDPTMKIWKDFWN